MRRKSKVTPEMEDKMGELKNQGLTNKKISEQMDVSEQCVQRHLQY